MKIIGYIIRNGGHAITMKPTLEKGCDITRSFASRGKHEIIFRGMTLVIPEDVTREALEEAKHLIELKLANL